MISRTMGGVALAIVCGACASRSPIDVREHTTHPVAVDFPSLAFPAIDSVTLASLSAQLERLARDSSLLSALSPSEPRMYALFRELEAAQEQFAIALTTPDAAGQTLYDRLRTLSAHTDSLLRALQERDRQAPRPEK